MKTVTYDEAKWKLVPFDLPQEMVDEAYAEGTLTVWQIKEHWAKLLNASPEPPEAESKAEPDEQAADSLNEWLDTCDESGSSIQHRIECAGLNEMFSWVERAFNAGRDSVERPPAAERVPLSEEHIDAGLFERVGEGFNGDDGALFEAGVRFAEAAHGIRGES